MWASLEYKLALGLWLEGRLTERAGSRCRDRQSTERGRQRLQPPPGCDAGFGDQRAGPGPRLA